VDTCDEDTWIWPQVARGNRDSSAILNFRNLSEFYVSFVTSRVFTLVFCDVIDFPEPLGLFYVELLGLLRSFFIVLFLFFWIKRKLREIET